jgi:hypothetical protein
VTPTEKMIEAAKNILLGVSGVGKILEGSCLFLELAGTHLHDLVEGVEILNKTAEMTHTLSHIHYGFNGLEKQIIRKIHGATIEDLCHNLVSSFYNLKTALSKITAISHAILHHYEESFKNLPPEQAARVAKYAVLKLLALWMSGCLPKLLSADALIELSILHLSYTPIKNMTIHVDLLNKNEKLAAEAFFMGPALKFYSEGNYPEEGNDTDTEEEHEADAYCAVNNQNAAHPNDDHIAPTPKRFATKAEIIVLNELLKMRQRDKNFSKPLATLTPIKYLLNFNSQDLLVLDEKNMPFETKLSRYKSPSKKDKEQRKINKEQAKINTELRRQVNFLMQQNREHEEQDNPEELVQNRVNV